MVAKGVSGPSSGERVDDVGDAAAAADTAGILVKGVDERREVNKESESIEAALDEEGREEGDPDAVAMLWFLDLDGPPSPIPPAPPTAAPTTTTGSKGKLEKGLMKMDDITGTLLCLFFLFFLGCC